MEADLKHLTDIELCAIVHDGDSRRNAAFEILYDRHSPRVYTYCRRVLGDITVLDDVFQETFVRFYNSLLGNREMTNVPAFILRIARNLCLGEKDRIKNQAVAFEEFHSLATLPTFESEEMMKLIDMALTMLPEEFREVFVLREFMGFSYNEIAETLGTTMPTIRTRIYRAKNMIREILAPYITDINS